MAERESHSVRNGVIGTVVGGVALAALGELWPPLKNAAAWLWSKVLAFFDIFSTTYTVPGWVLAIMGLLALITLVRFVVALRSSGSNEPVYLTYVEDQLFGATWRWIWGGGEITGLWCFCPRCDAELVYDDSAAHDSYSREAPNTRFICEHCQNLEVAKIEGGGKSYALEAVGREIRRRIRTGLATGIANKG